MTVYNTRGLKEKRNRRTITPVLSSNVTIPDDTTIDSNIVKHVIDTGILICSRNPTADRIAAIIHCMWTTESLHEIRSYLVILINS